MTRKLIILAAAIRYLNEKGVRRIHFKLELGSIGNALLKCMTIY